MVGVLLFLAAPEIAVFQTNESSRQVREYLSKQEIDQFVARLQTQTKQRFQDPTISSVSWLPSAAFNAGAPQCGLAGNPPSGCLDYQVRLRNVNTAPETIDSITYVTECVAGGPFDKGPLLHPQLNCPSQLARIQITKSNPLTGVTTQFHPLSNEISAAAACFQFQVDCSTNTISAVKAETGFLYFLGQRPEVIRNNTFLPIGSGSDIEFLGAGY